MRLTLLTFFLSSLYVSQTSDDVNLLKHEITEMFASGSIPPHLPRHLELYQMPKLFRPTTKKLHKNFFVCSLCNFIFDQAIEARRNGTSKDVITTLLQFLCAFLKIESPRVCTGTISINADVAFYIIDNSRVSGKKICGVLLQVVGCPAVEDQQWSVLLPPLIETIPTNYTSVETFKILQLSDIHYDPNYLPYGNPDCEEPLCCQNDQNHTEGYSTSCGFWTDYRNADSSWNLILETIKQLKTHDVDYIYFTGDVISHRVWDTSISKNQATISQLYSLLHQSFDIPVYPIFGNHEPHPLNLWTPKNVTSFSTAWLLELAAKFWPDLAGENITETVLEGGYYTVSPKPGFRIIAINSNPCFIFNLWLLLDQSDLHEQLQWLADTLKEAEDNNERVHILSHIPGGTSECLQKWDLEYSRIVERFSHIITGQFNGHSHWDEFRVFYSGTKPISTAFNGASLTPYSWSNPSYKIYEVDSETFSLRDYEQWTFDLSTASNESLQWYREYSFVEAYGVESLDPIQVDQVLYKMTENRSLLQDYYRFKYRDSVYMLAIGCDSNCERENLCQIATTVFGEDSHCERFLELYSGTEKIYLHYCVLILSMLLSIL